MSRKLTLLFGLSGCFVSLSAQFCINKPHFQSSTDKSNRILGIELLQQAGAMNLDGPIRTMEQPGYLRAGLTFSHKPEYSHLGLA